ncbi:hypothetical protein BHM03_00037576 [Ensete ventricosum]|nr:hypothetical protein BHM03_00037576 [Ensete ventricosum]
MNFTPLDHYIRISFLEGEVSSLLFLFFCPVPVATPPNSLDKVKYMEFMRKGPWEILSNEKTTTGTEHMDSRTAMLDSPQEHFSAEAIPKAPRRPGNAAAAPCSLLEMLLERRAREPWRPAREETRYRKLSL